MGIKNFSENIHAKIYRRLLDVVPALLTIEHHGKSEVDGLMSLSFDVVQRTSEKLTIALSHYYKHPSGDMIPDPDMMVAVYTNQGMAEALTYQDMYMLTTVYSPDGTRVDVKAKRSLNEFLYTWLRNLIEQGHSIKSGTEHG